jgi:SAM-dependent methyltransferase
MTDGPAFYDDKDVFDTYTSRRARPDNPNTTLEKPITWELLGNVAGANVLDLGCGDGAFGLELLQAGCRAYTGLEGSQRMLAQASETLQHPAIKLILTRMETWEYPAEQFDLVVSRLALHYIEEIDPLFALVHKTLVPGGRFVFCVEHPVITSNNRSLEEGGGVRQAWLVDNYFMSGARDVAWLNHRVIKYHRTIEDYFMALSTASFTITHLRESRPLRENFTDESLFQRRVRIPLFLFFAAVRA